MATLHFMINSADAERMMLNLDNSVSPEALSLWLGIKVGPYLHERARRRFANEGDDVSGKWKPLRPATNFFRHAYGFTPVTPINIRTGALYDYITKAPNTIVPTPFGATLKTPGDAPSDPLTAHKLKVAQKGQDYRKGSKKSGRATQYRTPARPVMGVGIVDATFVHTALMDHIIGSAL